MRDTFGLFAGADGSGGMRDAMGAVGNELSGIAENLKVAIVRVDQAGDYIRMASLSTYPRPFSL